MALGQIRKADGWHKWPTVVEISHARSKEARILVQSSSATFTQNVRKEEIRFIMCTHSFTRIHRVSFCTLLSLCRSTVQRQWWCYLSERWQLWPDCVGNKQRLVDRVLQQLVRSLYQICPRLQAAGNWYQRSEFECQRLNIFFKYLSCNRCKG